MKLSEALATVQRRQGADPVHTYYLVCGCQPLHLGTFLQAHLLGRIPDAGVALETGLYGDFAGNLRRAAQSSAIASAAVLEWADIDPRLGLRSAGGWTASAKADALAASKAQFAHLLDDAAQLAVRMPVAFCPPTLPLPPLGHTAGRQASAFELDLGEQLASFLARLGRMPGVRLLHAARLESLAAGLPRLDPKMELAAGFPYTLPFASALAEALAAVLRPSPPKKGLITDLDDTLWSGIVGEIGPDAISWRQETHTQAHGLYQQMLGHLADCGVLVGACSKNEPEPVRGALARPDLYFDSSVLYPIEVSWGPKSQGIARILAAWNIAADAVVFVDDNPMELAEVERAFPGITCLRFPGNDPARVWELLEQLRDHFGKPSLSEEDRLRAASLRAASEMRQEAESAGPAEFLRSLRGKVALAYQRDASDARPLDLINKTNQFNLNGERIGEGEWKRMLEDDGSILSVASYEDRFGPLGKIAVLVASPHGERRVRVLHWVMSCRAFSRRIEHHTLDGLFRKTNADEIVFDFRPTPRNGPLQEFLAAIGALPGDGASCRITRAAFDAALSGDGLPHEVVEQAG
jgi:FkbH-like protein